MLTFDFLVCIYSQTLVIVAVTGQGCSCWRIRDEIIMSNEIA